MSTLSRVLGMTALVCGTAFGQSQISSGDITGTVTDPSGSAVAKAKITASESDRGITRSAQTNAAGEFRIPLVPPGLYRVRIEAPGFAAKLIDGVEVRVGDTVVVPGELSLSQVETEISVTAGVPTVEAERTQQSTTIQSQQIHNLPINRRNYLDFALLTPAAETNDMVDGTDFRVVQTPQSGLSFGGGNGRGNAFAVDGVENYVNSGGVRPSVSQEAANEFQINRNSFSAEFGGAFGGVVNIVTRSGSNEVHGNVFGFLRHKNIQARNFFDPGKSSFTRSQAGATLGAPLARDRTFVFLAFERLDRNEANFVPILDDPTVFSRLTASQQQLFDFFSAAPSPELRGLAAIGRQALLTTSYPRTLEMFRRNSGNFPYFEDATQFSFRLDHHFNDSHHTFMRGNLTGDFSRNAQLG
ncbi:MAG: carboxypeptidase regulatory-like domain-containing protein, partial [Acidobacteria bacterium]|nr:carboxypeptidase regulatory-like domain-containing protein [Acidobacteriota bacterium]